MPKADFVGVIIEESLEDKSVLWKVKILSTKIEKVVETIHKTPWLSRWTLHTVTIPEGKAEEIAEDLSRSLDRRHGGSWYADFKNDKTHFIIFRGKIFKIERTSKEQYEEATRYGISLGIPDYQVDFSPHIKKWKR
jgi:hypothetical protein